MKRRPLAVAMGVIADLAVGEPPVEPHPVAVFGRVMQRVEESCYRDTRLAGVAHAMAGIAVGASAGTVMRSPAAATYLVTAGRGLADAARAVHAALGNGDLDRARGLLPALVGRDPWRLDDKEIARAVIESVAENTVDAVVGPAFWALVGGATGALTYRAINTLDSMVGHRSPRYLRYGWASARADDVAAFLPARLTALLVAAVRPRAAGAVVRAVVRDAPRHPSPNAGVAEAAFAGALGLRLGGENAYASRIEVRPSLGAGRTPEPADIERAVVLSRDVTFAALAALLIMAIRG